MDIISRIGIASLVIMLTLPLPAKADMEQGSKIYQEHCATCHGEKLEGGLGSSFTDHIWNYGAQTEQISRNVKFGLPDLEMPPWKDNLSDDDIKSVVGYIMSQEKKSKLSKPEIASHITTELYNLRVDILDQSLVDPWAIAFISENKALVTDRPGKIYLMLNGVIQKDAIKDTPDDVAYGGQGGMLDLVLDPDYGDNGWIYLSYSHALGRGSLFRTKSMTRIVRGRIKDGHWVDQQVLFQAPEEYYTTSGRHFGSRITFDDRGRLYFSVGDRGDRDQAQDLSRPNGKIHRINRDGTIPDDNPFVGQDGVMSSIFSYGNRNPQGMATHPATGEIWAAEHGPKGGDELNHIRAGRNYGWPVITFGVNYIGTTISEYTEKPGMEQPVIHWTPSIAVADIDFYNGKMFPEWQNNLLVTSLKYRDFRRLVIEGDKVIHQEILLKDMGRVRSITVSPAGALYLLMVDPSLILRLTPRP